MSALEAFSIDLLAAGRAEAEVYVADENLADLVRDYALFESDRANLIVRVSAGVWPFKDDAEVAPAPVVALDLIDAGDDRSRRAGAALLDDVLRRVRAGSTSNPRR